MTYNSTVLADSPTHYLTFDQTNGSYTDSGSAGATISKQGSPTVNTSSFISGASVNLDGTSQGLSINGSVDFSAGTAWTFEAWFKTTVGTGTPEIIRKDGAGRAYLLRLNSGNIEWYCNQAGVVTSGTNYADGKWHHVVATYSLGTTRIYVDGAQYTTTGNGTSGSQGTVAAYVGSSGGASEWFGGSLDEVAIYTTALSAARVTAHYNAGTPKPVTVTPPAMIVSASAPAPVVVDPYHQSYVATADKDGGSGSGTAAVVRLGYSTNTLQANFKFVQPTLPVNTSVDSAVLNLNVESIQGGGITTYRVVRITSDWSESDLNQPQVSGAYLTGQSLSQAGTLSIDVTSIVRDWITNGLPCYGIALIAEDGGAATWANISSRESATVTNRPRLVVNAINTPITTVAPTPMTASASAPVPVVSISVSATVSVPAATASAVMTNPVVGVGRNIIAQPEYMAASVDFLSGKVVTPDFTAKPVAMGVAVTVPTPNEFIAMDKVISVTGAMTLGTGEADASISMTTERLVRVPSAMILSARAVGYYTQGNDRYFTAVPGTSEPDDIWYKMDETSGVTALDALVDPLRPALNADGAYVGNVELSASGPQGRRAVHFDGTSYLSMGAFYDTFSQMDATVEFSIKTSQQNGVIFTGGATTYFGPIAGASAATIPTGSGRAVEVRLLNGEVIIDPGSIYGTVYKTRTNIADDQWHHVILSVPYQSTAAHDAYNLSSFAPFFMMIDGKIVWSRHTAVVEGHAMLPVTFMSRKGTQNLAGDLSSVVVRSNYAVSEDTALSLYYEWSNTILVRPAPMTMGIEGVDPVKVRGNVKRMLCLYGLPLTLSLFGTRDGAFNYTSVWSGINIPSTDPQHPAPTSNLTRMNYWNVQSFQLDDFLVYPAAIMHQPGSNGGPFSAAGIENGEYFDKYEGAYIDDETGLPRFIDLQKDLVEDISDFDAITVINYPAPYPIDGPTGSSADKTFEPRQHSMGLSDGEWDRARNKLRDSILEAVYDGLNIWITEPEMALNLGFIEGYDKHDTGVGYGDDQLGYTNWAAAYFDIDHFIGNDEQKARQLELIKPGKPGEGHGRYSPTWQANAQRVVVNEQEGITDLPSYEYADMVSFKSNNAWEPHSTWYAYDLQDASDGLYVGQVLGIPNMAEVWGLGDITSGLGGSNQAGGYMDVYNLAWNPRLFIVSARPDGIAGMPLTKENDWYFGPYAEEIDNPYKDNVYTIVAERGTVVRGRAIAGRAFIEFMDTCTQQEWIAADAAWHVWNGRLVVDGGYSNWSFDTRRQIEVLSFIEYTLSTSQKRGESRINYKTKVQDPYIVTTPADQFWLCQYWSMNARGLSWLAEDSQMQDGEVLVYAPSMKVNVSGGAVVPTANRNIVEPVNGAMRLDVELRHPANYLSDDVYEHALPMVLDMKMNGIGNTIRVTPIVLAITAPNADGRGERESIYIYMDEDRDITLYMKEDS